MAVSGMIRNLCAVLAVLGLSACGNSTNSALVELARALPKAVLPADPTAGNITATRASLLAAGFSDPLIVVGVPSTGVRGGMLLAQNKQGVEFWQAAAGGSTIRLQSGVLRGTTGLGTDLYSAGTRNAANALGTGQPAQYERRFQHLLGDGTLLERTYACALAPVGPETIVVFDKKHETLKSRETCEAEVDDTVDGRSRFTNLYWKDKHGPTVWRSEQWVHPAMGHIVLEIVFR